MINEKEKYAEKFGFIKEDDSGVLYLVFKSEANIPFDEGIKEIQRGKYGLFNLQANLKEEEEVEKIIQQQNQ